MTGGRWDLGVSGLLAFLHSIRFRITLWFVLILAIVLVFPTGIGGAAHRLRQTVARR